MYDGLKAAGFEVNRPGATFYQWMKVPNGTSSADYAAVVLERAGVLATPGSGFGPSGEGYFRLSAFGSRENVIEAIKRFREKWQK